MTCPPIRSSLGLTEAGLLAQHGSFPGSDLGSQWEDITVLSLWPGSPRPYASCSHCRLTVAVNPHLFVYLFI